VLWRFGYAPRIGKRQPEFDSFNGNKLYLEVVSVVFFFQTFGYAIYPQTPTIPGFIEELEL
jgi:hypothetical protein